MGNLRLEILEALVQYKRTLSKEADSSEVVCRIKRLFGEFRVKVDENQEQLTPAPEVLKIQIIDFLILFLKNPEFLLRFSFKIAQIKTICNALINDPKESKLLRIFSTLLRLLKLISFCNSLFLFENRKTLLSESHRFPRLNRFYQIFLEQLLSIHSRQTYIDRDLIIDNVNQILTASKPTETSLQKLNLRISNHKDVDGDLRKEKKNLTCMTNQVRNVKVLINLMVTLQQSVVRHIHLTKSEIFLFSGILSYIGNSRIADRSRVLLQMGSLMSRLPLPGVRTLSPVRLLLLHNLNSSFLFVEKLFQVSKCPGQSEDPVVSMRKRLNETLNIVQTVRINDNKIENQLLSELIISPFLLRSIDSTILFGNRFGTSEIKRLKNLTSLNSFDIPLIAPSCSKVKHKEFFSRKNMDTLFFYSFQNPHFLSTLLLDPYLDSLRLMYPTETEERAFEMMVDDISDLLRKNAFVALLQQMAPPARRRSRSCPLLKSLASRSKRRTFGRASKRASEKLSFMKKSKVSKCFELILLQKIKEHQNRKTLSFNHLLISNKRRKRNDKTADTLSIPKRRKSDSIHLLTPSLKIANLSLKQIKRKADYYSCKFEEVAARPLKSRKIAQFKIRKEYPLEISFSFFKNEGIKLFFGEPIKNFINKYPQSHEETRTPKFADPVSLCLYNPEDVLFQKLRDKMESINSASNVFHLTNSEKDYLDLLGHISQQRRRLRSSAKLLSQGIPSKRHSNFLRKFIKQFKQMSESKLSFRRADSDLSLFDNNQIFVFLPPGFERLPALIADCGHLLSKETRSPLKISKALSGLLSHPKGSVPNQPSLDMSVTLFCPTSTGRAPECLSHMRPVRVVNLFKSSSAALSLYVREQFKMLTFSSKYLFYLAKSEALFTKLVEYPVSLANLYATFRESSFSSTNVMNSLSAEIFQNIKKFDQMISLISSFMVEFKAIKGSHLIFRFLSKYFEKQKAGASKLPLDVVIHLCYSFVLERKSHGPAHETLASFFVFFGRVIEGMLSTSDLVFLKYSLVLFLLENLYSLLEPIAKKKSVLGRIKPSIKLASLYSSIITDFPSYKQNGRFERFFKDLKPYLHVSSFNHVYHSISKNQLIKLQRTNFKSVLKSTPANIFEDYPDLPYDLLFVSAVHAFPLSLDKIVTNFYWKLTRLKFPDFEEIFAKPAPAVKTLALRSSVKIKVTGNHPSAHFPEDDEQKEFLDLLPAPLLGETSVFHFADIDQSFAIRYVLDGVIRKFEDRQSPSSTNTQTKSAFLSPMDTTTAPTSGKTSVRHFYMEQCFQIDSREPEPEGSVQTVFVFHDPPLHTLEFQVLLARLKNRDKTKCLIFSDTPSGNNDLASQGTVTFRAQPGKKFMHLVLANIRVMDCLLSSKLPFEFYKLLLCWVNLLSIPDTSIGLDIFPFFDSLCRLLKHNVKHPENLIYVLSIFTGLLSEEISLEKMANPYLLISNLFSKTSQSLNLFGLNSQLFGWFPSGTILSHPETLVHMLVNNRQHYTRHVKKLLFVSNYHANLLTFKSVSSATQSAPFRIVNLTHFTNLFPLILPTHAKLKLDFDVKIRPCFCKIIFGNLDQNVEGSEASLSQKSSSGSHPDLLSPTSVVSVSKKMYGEFSGIRVFSPGEHLDTGRSVQIDLNQPRLIARTKTQRYQYSNQTRICLSCAKIYLFLRNLKELFLRLKRLHLFDKQNMLGSLSIYNTNSKKFIISEIKKYNSTVSGLRDTIGFFVFHLGLETFFSENNLSLHSDNFSHTSIPTFNSINAPGPDSDFQATNSSYTAKHSKQSRSKSRQGGFKGPVAQALSKVKMVKNILKFSKLVKNSKEASQPRESLISHRNSTDSNLFSYLEKDDLKFGKNILGKKSKPSIA